MSRPRGGVWLRARWHTLLAFCLSVWVTAAVAAPSVAFYYGSGMAPRAFRDFDWVVVNPGLKRLPRDFAPKQTVFAYLSVGESVPGNPLYGQLPKVCAMGRNMSWGGTIINLAKRRCRRFLLRHVAGPAWKAGYRGFFLDTLNSYELVVHGRRHLAAQRSGLVAFVRSLAKRYPGVKLIANRGFSVFPRIRKDLVAVTAEGLYHAWNEARQRYETVAHATRAALLAQLKRIGAQRMPVIVIDYLPTRMQRAGWWQDARRIARQGFIPYVTNGDLTAVGAGLEEPMPRRVLVLYGSNKPRDDSTAFLCAIMPLEYLGYVPVMHRLGDNVAEPRPGQYAGVIVWSDGQSTPNASALIEFLGNCRAAGVPVLFMNGVAGGSNHRFAHTLGVRLQSGRAMGPVQVRAESAGFGYEMPVRARARDFTVAQAPPGSQVWLALTRGGKQEDAAAITSWGGYVLAPYVLTTLPNKVTRWLVDPFALYCAALRLPKMPVPDTTTESGRRLFMAQADGDGFLSRTEFPPYHIAGETYFHRILLRYRLPFTGSVIVGDLLPGKAGMFPAMAPLGARIARDIFRLPYVEIGSHMWSHPFNWPAIEAGRRYPGINLPVPHYHFNPYMEAVGAARWIDTHLVPQGKKVVIDQWSGDCEPDAQVLGLAYQAGLMNVNGGNSFISRRDSSITAVPPLGIFRGPYLQVFAPDANEDYFTNFWRGPFWGFENVIQTFRMTDRPHRLKPIDIYTHWYSATRLASLAALKKVYAWVLKRPITPIYVADYARIVLDYFHVHIARASGGFVIIGAHALRELRMPPGLGVPNLMRSRHVAGFDKSPNGNWYVHLDGHSPAYLALSARITRVAYIVDANAPISHFRRQGRGFSAQLRGTVPVWLRLAGVAGCRVLANGKTVPAPGGVVGTRGNRVTLDVRCGAHA